jgi:hypothetical protein
VAYQSLTLLILISAPGDVPEEDIEAVREAISRWNFRSGRRMRPIPVTVVGVSWGEHAHSIFGMRPQEAINAQLVEEADLAFAMFADRLGTPTGEAGSGTVEEIDVMLKADKHVSLVRNVMPRSTTRVAATTEKMRLEQYLERVEKDRRGLVRKYTSLVDLAEEVNIVLTVLADRFVQGAVAAAAQPEPPPGEDLSKGVWPTVEVIERPKTDSRGRLTTSRNWYLVLTNTTGRPVRNVRFRYVTGGDEPDDSIDFQGREEEPIAVLPPDGTARFPIALTLASNRESMCVVTWEDDLGEHERRATVRAV